jgi:hypothetical protein
MSANSDKNYLMLTVDTGLKGAIVLSERSGSDLKILNAFPFRFKEGFIDLLNTISSTHLIALKTALKRKLEIKKIIEEPFSCSKNSRLGISSQFAIYGGTYLALEMQSATKIIKVKPISWVSKICTKNERELKKEGRILACKRIFGDKVTEFLEVKKPRSTILHDGIADAALIAAYFVKMDN